MIDHNKGKEYLEGIGELKLAMDSWIPQLISRKVVDNNSSAFEEEYCLYTEAGRIYLTECHDIKNKILTVTLEYVDKHHCYVGGYGLDSKIKITADYGQLIVNTPTYYHISAHGILEHLEPNEFKTFFKSMLMLDKYNIRPQLD